MSSSKPESFDDSELDNLTLSEDWVNDAKATEDTADSRVERYSKIHQAHQTAAPPRSWTPGQSSGNSTGPNTWVKVTAIILVVTALLAALTLLRMLG